MKSLKKKLNTAIKAKPDAEVLFFDESRFGTHSKIGHGWFETGKRTQLNISLGFKNFYIYSAVSSTTGNSCSLILPNVDTDCMSVFLSELALSFANKPILLVLDGAGWHRSRELVVPSNVELFFLPPYSPELNPVENLWEYIKANTIKNKIFKCITALEVYVSEFIRNISNATIMSVCSCSYLRS